MKHAEAEGYPIFAKAFLKSTSQILCYQGKSGNSVYGLTAISV